MHAAKILVTDGTEICERFAKILEVGDVVRMPCGDFVVTEGPIRHEMISVGVGLHWGLVFMAKPSVIHPVKKKAVRG